MFNSDQLIEFGIVGQIYAKLKLDAANTTKLTPNESLMVFNNVVLNAKAPHKAEYIELFDFVTGKFVARCYSLTDVLKSFELWK